ncbi:hypothetical protein L2E82_32134 [Cichorium intybus]|uniref:Uncharacterized protein n=1 Tax=Cichorium intybus TaxID=13427 RepID=A0ACB9BFZ6_CICIN|nr:hypothetical protein L2E82_32134 [Cichorium intybus]
MKRENLAVNKHHEARYALIGVFVESPFLGLIFVSMATYPITCCEPKKNITPSDVLQDFYFQSKATWI